MRLLDQLPCAVLVTDGAGRLLDLNTGLLAMLGGTREHWLGASIEAMLPPNTVPLSLMLAASGARSRRRWPSQPALRMPMAATGGMAR